MALIIDGYNLIHAANILGRGVGPGGLERARIALLEFLVASYDQQQRRAIVVVFDAEHAPPGLPRTVDYHGITVRFSAGYRDADELIEELIQKHSAPRKLTVVSSDHRIHRAAKRRRATPVDSDVWYAEAVRRRIERRAQQDAESQEQIAPGSLVSPGEIARWSRELAQEGLDPIFPPDYGADLNEEDDEL